MRFLTLIFACNICKKKKKTGKIDGLEGTETKKIQASISLHNAKFRKEHLTVQYKQVLFLPFTYI